MKYLKRKHQTNSKNIVLEDPMSSVANLFDVALVFIVALFLSLMSAYQILDFFNPESEITIMKKTNEQWHIITKKGKKIEAKKVTNRKIGGDQGVKLGIAYKLNNGQVIYIPEEQLNEIE
ncbi:MAG: DUF2149 domain-containing protein [Desulfobacteraceae bacterium]|nr:DUF2149 domain-containing protein [Desulfobacteraceae bacterium]